MILYLYGDNSYAINRQLAAIKGKYLDKTGQDGDFSSYDLKNADINGLLADLRALPMFSTSRLVFAENAVGSKLSVEQIDGLISDLPESTNLVFVDYTPDKRTSIFKKLAGLKGAKRYDRLPADKLPQWVVAEAKKAGAKIDYGVARYLVEHVGADQWLLYNEIQKLSQAGAEITKQTIQSLSSPSFESTAFQLAEALIKRDLKKSLEIYDGLKLQGSADQMIQGAIIYQYRTILLATLDDSELLAAYKLGSYPIQKARALSRGVGLDQIKSAYHKIAQADLAVKTGELPATEAMQGLIYEIGRAHV